MNPLVLLLFVLSAHNDALMVGMMIAGLTLVLERRPSRESCSSPVPSR